MWFVGCVMFILVELLFILEIVELMLMILMFFCFLGEGFNFWKIVKKKCNSSKCVEDEFFVVVCLMNCYFGEVFIM